MAESLSTSNSEMIEKSREEIAALSNEDLGINLQAAVISGRLELIKLYSDEAAERLAKQK